MELDNQLLEIYMDEDEEIIYRGFLLFEDMDGMIYEVIDEYGRYDFLLWVRKDAISYDYGEMMDLKKYEYFIEYNKKRATYKPHDIIPFRAIDEDNLLEEIIMLMYWMDQLVSIEFDSEEDLETGYIRQVEDDYIMMMSIDTMSCKNVEEVKYDIDDIVSIEFNSVENQMYRYANTMASKGRIGV